VTDGAGGVPASRDLAPEGRIGRLLSVLVLLVVVVAGVPQVWQRLATGGLGLELFFYPLLGAAFLLRLVSRR
jgi:hypothetical protein